MLEQCDICDRLQSVRQNYLLSMWRRGELLSQLRVLPRRRGGLT